MKSWVQALVKSRLFINAHMPEFVGSKQYLLLLFVSFYSLFCIADSALAANCSAVTPDTHPSSVKIDGQDRPFILVLPANYQATKSYRLVFAFHGRTNTNKQVRSYFNLESVSRQDTIFVYPSATTDQKGRNHWWRKTDKANALRGYELFDKILTSLKTSYCIDSNKIYLIGHSLGATFANSLACARAEKIRAVISVAGGIRGATCKGKVAAMLIHNPKDELVKISDGVRARDQFLQINQLTDIPISTEPQSLNCLRYGKINEPNPVIWCEHHQDYNGHKRYYPHNWPAQTAKAAFDFFEGLL